MTIKPTIKNSVLRRLIVVFCLFSMGAFVNFAQAQDSFIENASVEFRGVSDETILKNVISSVALYQQALKLSKKKPIEKYQWQRLISLAEVEIENALKPYGYYLSTVNHSSSTDLSKVTFEINLGAPVILNNVSVIIEGESSETDVIRNWIDAYPLKKGDVLVQPQYDDAKSKLNQLLRRFGYLDARFVKQEIAVNVERTEAAISLLVQIGERYRYGEFELDWRSEKQVGAYSEGFLERYLTLKPGEGFDSQALQKAQGDMSNSTYFSYTELRPLFDEAKDGVVPIRVSIEAPKRLSYGASLGFGTDSGPRTGLTFENRRVNQLGHRFNGELIASTEKQTIVGNYSIPSNGSKRDGLNLFTSFINENSDVRDSNLWLAGFDFNKSLSDQTQLSYGVSFRDESFIESSQSFESQLLLPSVTWQTVSADSLRNPNRGYRVSASLRGADSDLGSDISFAQLTLNAKSVYSLGSGRLIGRAQIGQTIIDDGDQLPSSLSFFTGGDHSVRGYDFESIGVQNVDGDFVGGQNVIATSIEYEQQIRGPFALAAFIDAGDAYDDSLDLKVGVGVGARWRLPFGAVRLDIASARDLEGEPVRLHFTFGTDL